MTGYPAQTIMEEVAFIAYHFHWSHDEIMDMEHKDRQAWCREISKINKELSDQTDNVFHV